MTTRECWLRPNRRGLAIGFLAPLLLLAAAALVLFLGFGASRYYVAEILGGGLLGVALFMLVALLRAGLQPRLAYAEGELWVGLGTWRPLRVPLEVVEVFFIGQGSSLLPGTGGESPRSTTLIVRLAEAEKGWHERPVQRVLGEWREGYIIIRGTWCEPITLDLVKQLNQKLAAAQREWKARAARGA